MADDGAAASRLIPVGLVPSVCMGTADKDGPAGASEIAASEVLDDRARRRRRRAARGRQLDVLWAHRFVRVDSSAGVVVAASLEGAAVAAATAQCGAYLKVSLVVGLGSFTGDSPVGLWCKNPPSHDACGIPR